MIFYLMSTATLFCNGDVGREFPASQFIACSSVSSSLNILNILGLRCSVELVHIQLIEQLLFSC